MGFISVIIVSAVLQAITYSLINVIERFHHQRLPDADPLEDTLA